MDTDRTGQGRAHGVYDEQLQRKVQEKRLKPRAPGERLAFFTTEKA